MPYTIKVKNKQNTENSVTKSKQPTDHIDRKRKKGNIVL